MRDSWRQSSVSSYAWLPLLGDQRRVDAFAGLSLLVMLCVPTKCISALVSKVRFVEAATESKDKALASSSCDDDSAASSIRQALSRGSTSVPNRLKPKLLVVEIKQMPSLEAAGARVLAKLPLSKKYDVCLHEECSDTASLCSAVVVVTPGDASIGKMLSLKVSDAGVEAFIPHKSGKSC